MSNLEEMISSLSKDGELTPRSIIDRKSADIPIRSANSSCVIRCSKRRSRRRSPNFRLKEDTIYLLVAMLRDGSVDRYDLYSYDNYEYKEVYDYGKQLTQRQYSHRLFGMGPMKSHAVGAEYEKDKIKKEATR